MYVCTCKISMLFTTHCRAQKVQHGHVQTRKKNENKRGKNVFWWYITIRMGQQRRFCTLGNWHIICISCCNKKKKNETMSGARLRSRKHFCTDASEEQTERQTDRLSKLAGIISFRHIQNPNPIQEEKYTLYCVLAVYVGLIKVLIHWFHLEIIIW